MAVWCPLLSGNIVFEISKPDMPCITFSRISLLHWRLILKVTQDWRQREDAGSGFWPFISPIDYITKCPKLNTNLGYVNTITDNFCAASKTIPDMIGLVFTHKNGDSGVISVMLQGCAVSCRSLKWRVTSWIGLHTIPGSFCACASRKPYRISLPFTHKNGDLGAISVTERSCARRSVTWSSEGGVLPYISHINMCRPKG